MHLEHLCSYPLYSPKACSRTRSVSLSRVNPHSTMSVGIRSTSTLSITTAKSLPNVQNMTRWAYLLSWNITLRSLSRRFQFEYVKRGDVITLKEICAVDITNCERKNGEYDFRDRKTRMKVYSIELFGQQSTGRFTAVEYKGEEADEVWEEHFQKFSRDRCLFSFIPMRNILTKIQTGIQIHGCCTD